MRCTDRHPSTRPRMLRRFDGYVARMDPADSPSRLVRMFVELCALPSPAREEGPAADFVRGFADGIGVGVVEDDAAARVPAGCGNLLLTLPPTAPGTPIFLCAHLDTVALNDALEPVLQEREGSQVVTNARPAILGGDNKAAVAVMLELMRELVEQSTPHAGLEVLLTPCEEIGLLGAKAFDTSVLQARFGYVFDHADDIGKVVVEAPTQISLRACFTGRAAHSGIAPEQGRSAIRAAADAIAAMPHGRVDARTTVNVGLIEGGTAVNIVPERCVLRGEVRSLDHDRCGRIAQEVLAACTDAATRHEVDVDVDMREEYRSYRLRERDPVLAHALAALRAAGVEPQLVPCGGGSDANVFNADGVACANICNAMRRIHTSDEYIDVADLHRMLDVARQLVLLARDAHEDGDATASTAAPDGHP